MKNIEEKTKKLRKKMEDRLSDELQMIEQTVPNKKDFYSDWHNPIFYSIAERNGNRMKEFDKLSSNFYLTMQETDTRNTPTYDPNTTSEIFARRNSAIFYEEYFKVNNDPVYKKVIELYQDSGTTIIGKIFGLPRRSTKLADTLFCNPKNETFAKTSILTERVKKAIEDRVMKKEEYDYYLNASLQYLKKDLKINKFQFSDEEIDAEKKSNRHMSKIIYPID
jgi:hypothetical protein